MAKHDPAPSLQRLLCRISRVPRSSEPGEAGLHFLTEEFSGNQIEHKLFGFLANQFLSHFVKFKIASVVYYLSCR